MVALLRPQPQLSLRQEAPRQLRLVVDDGQLVVPSADHRLSRRSARPATKSAVVADRLTLRHELVSTYGKTSAFVRTTCQALAEHAEFPLGVLHAPKALRHR